MKCCLALLLASISIATLAEAAVGPDEKPRLEQQLLNPADVTDIGGFLGARLRLNAGNRLMTFDIDRFVKMVEVKQHRDWWWIGEQPWKWLEAAMDSAQALHDEALAAEARRVLQRLTAAQEKDGYIGITHPDLRKPLRGMDAYELYFALHCLISAYERFEHEAPIKQAAVALGDYFVNTIGPGKAEFWPEDYGKTIAGHSVHCSLEGTLLIDPMARLAQLTGDERYLTWCLWCVSNIDRWSRHKTFTNLTHAAKGEIGLEQIQPTVHSHTLHMNLLGFLRLYQLTGDRVYVDIVTGVWKQITASRMYITGGVSVGESYRAPYELPNGGDVCETCATMSWCFLNMALLELTGEAKYADVIETIMWNMAPAAQTHDGKGWRYHTPPNGTKPLGYFTGPDCCSSSGPRLLSQLPMAICGAADNAIYVNQFVQSKALIELSRGAVAVEQETTYPAGDKVSMRIEVERPVFFSLYVRIPGWCDAASVSVGGRKLELEPKPGEYFEIVPPGRRPWRSDDRVEITLPMSPRWIDGTHGNTGLTALVRGPVVYCLDTIYSSEADRLALAGMDPRPAMTLVPGLRAVVRTGELKEVDAPPDALGPFYSCDIILTSGERRTATLVPYANVGRYQRPGSEEAFRPEPRFPYAVWMPFEDEAKEAEPE